MAFQYRLFTLEYNNHFNQLSKHIQYIPLRVTDKERSRRVSPQGRKDPSQKNPYKDHSAPTMWDSPDFLVILQRLLYQLRDFRYFHTSDFTTPQNLFLRTDCYLKTNQIAFSSRTKNMRLAFLTLQFKPDFFPSVKLTQQGKLWELFKVPEGRPQ